MTIDQFATVLSKTPHSWLISRPASAVVDEPGLLRARKEKISYCPLSATYESIYHRSAPPIARAAVIAFGMEMGLTREDCEGVIRASDGLYIEPGDEGIREKLEAAVGLREPPAVEEPF